MFVAALVAILVSQCLQGAFANGGARITQCDGHDVDSGSCPAPADQNALGASGNLKVVQDDVIAKETMLEEKRPPTNEMPSIWHYHLHVMYVDHEPAQMKSAFAFRQQLIDRFNLTNAPFCNSLMHNEQLCVWETSDNVGPPTHPDNPFPINEWGAFVPLDMFSEVVMWANLNRGDNVLLIHPNTGYERNDHAKWSMWSGAIYPLRLSALCEYCHTY